MDSPTLASIRPMPSAEVISELETLLAAAKRGEIFGMAYAILKPAQKYEIGTAGLYRIHPDAALGSVNRLLNHLATR